MKAHPSVGRGGFTLHAATRAGAMDERGRETLLKYVLRPPLAQERVTPGPEGLVRIGLKKPFSDGTFAVDLDPLSLPTRLSAAVPPPRMYTVRYAGVLASASKLRPRILPEPPQEVGGAVELESRRREAKRGGLRCRYRPWAELMKRTFSADVLCCPRCQGRLRLVALMTEPKEIRRYLRALGEPTQAPARSGARGPPFWRSRVLRRRAGGLDAACPRVWRQAARAVLRDLALSSRCPGGDVHPELDATPERWPASPQLCPLRRLGPALQPLLLGRFAAQPAARDRDKPGLIRLL